MSKMPNYSNLGPNTEQVHILEKQANDKAASRTKRVKSWHLLSIQIGKIGYIPWIIIAMTLFILLWIGDIYARYVANV